MLTVPPRFRRILSVASMACIANIAGLVAAQDASAQTRPAIVRDTDNGDLAPAYFSGQFPLNTVANTTITTVPAGKRLVIDSISYSCTSATTGDPLVQALLYVSTPQGTSSIRQYFPINAGHSYTSGNGGLAQDASFSTVAYFEAGEVVRFVGGTPSSDSSRTIGLTISGHYVTP